MIKLTKEKEMKDCLDKIKKEKVIPHKTNELLKDIEYDTEIIKKEICENLDDKSNSDEI
ncbi:MAG: hypothetical protein ACFFKA_18160 [Candidatus Thorarchaeota archaeon]